MKVLLSVYFFIFAAIQLGLLIGISHYLSGKSQKNPNAYWLGALLTSICGLFLFAIGILFTDDVQFPPFVFTVANVFFFIGAIFQGLFFYSINTAIKKPLLIGFALAFFQQYSLKHCDCLHQLGRLVNLLYLLYYLPYK